MFRFRRDPVRTKIVAFCGYKGSGKDTAADALIKGLNYKVGTIRRINFADPVRQLCMSVYGLTLEEVKDPILKEKVLERWPHKSPRFLMQEFATQMFRVRYPSIWIRYWERTFNEAERLPGLNIFVITDLRFPNEYEMLREKGAFIIRIKRLSLDQIDTHESERHFDNFKVSFEVLNDRKQTNLEYSMRVTIARKLKEMWTNALS